MSDLRKAAELALDALHNIDHSNNDKVIDTLRTALAQPEQEPVAWMNPRNNAVIDAVKKKQIGEGDGYPRFSVPLYPAPVDTVNTSQERETAKGEHEPVAVGALSVRYFRGDKAMTDTDFEYFGDLPEGDYTLYTAPPKREWQGLADEETLDVLIRSRAAISAIRTDAGHPIKGSILMADTNEYLIDVLDKTIEKALKKS